MLCILSINIYEAPLHKILHLIISSHHCTSSSTPAKPKTNLGVTVRDHIRHMAWRGCQPSHSSNILWGRGRAKYIIPYWQDHICYSLLAGPNILLLIGKGMEMCCAVHLHALSISACFQVKLQRLRPRRTVRLVFRFAQSFTESEVPRRQIRTQISSSFT